MNNRLLTTQQGSLNLNRYPVERHDLLRAWDTADEYVLNHIAEYKLLGPNDRVLVINDGFGAVSLSLHANSPVIFSDSYLSHQAILNNAVANNIPASDITFHTIDELARDKFDLVIIKLPKNMGLFEYELIELRKLLKENSRIIVAGMVKYMPASAWALLEKTLGKTETSRAWKKSRLIFVNSIESMDMPPGPYPVCYQLENTTYKICNHANVFSRDSLDIGTRFFLQNLPENDKYKTIVDLGCGNGVVGLIASAGNPAAKLYFVDESYMAIDSARDNYLRAFGSKRNADFLVADGLADFAPESVDLILCNPPFHQQQAVGDQVAVRMFKQSREALKQQGELWVIGNRHLAYHARLRKLFGNVERVASNQKFVIHKVVKVTWL
ncbi:MAG: methyltransferase [Gammaproteobacteria bacterium]|nr:methyltransferase [Gammaproteobacteria bacterium]